MEKLKPGPSRKFVTLCDLEIWQMTLIIDRAHFLCYIKLCASFQWHRWIQTGVTVWKRSIFSCDQAALWMVQSVCLSVCLSVCHTFLIMFPSSYHHEIFRIITNARSDVHAKGQGQRSKVKVTEVTTQLNRFRTVIRVWIHIWWWNDTYSLMLLRWGALL